MNVTITTGEIIAEWSAIQRGETTLSPRQSRGLALIAPEFRSMGGSFYGATTEQFNGWLLNGYYPEPGENSLYAVGAVAADVAAMEFVEEDGDLVIESVLAGELDLPFIRWEPQPARRGLTINIPMGFRGTVQPHVIADFYKWALQLVENTATRGIAPDVNLTITGENRFARYTGKVEIRIPVIRSGELMDVVAWRAFLAPGAYRTLGFIAIGIAADKLGQESTVGMGRSISPGWGVVPGDGELTLTNDPMATRFPAAVMDAALSKAGM